ncbi:MAG: gliding motility protein GldC [Chitinophagales bacterium]|jgi:gliding motility-associated protein GldC|nr:gliding motility protein GldC [Chitinophagales bacterium]
MMSEDMLATRVSTISLMIGLDKNNIPEKINWEATDAAPGIHESNAMLLALWDHRDKTGMSIDIWTKEMTVPEMNLFFYQTISTLADTFLRATNNKLLSDDIKNFAREFIEKVKKSEKAG